MSSFAYLITLYNILFRFVFIDYLFIFSPKIVDLLMKRKINKNNKNKKKKTLKIKGDFNEVLKVTVKGIPKSGSKNKRK